MIQQKIEILRLVKFPSAFWDRHSKYSETIDGFRGYIDVDDVIFKFIIE